MGNIYLEKIATNNRDLDSYAAGYKSPITPTAKTVWQGMGTGAMMGGLSLIPTVKRDLLDGSGVALERLPKYIADLAIKGKTRVIGGGVAGALAGAAYAHHAYVKPHLAHHQDHEDVSGIEEYRLKHIDNRAPEYVAGAGGLYLGGKYPVPLPTAVTKKITNINPFLGPIAGRLISGAVASGAAAYGAKKAVDTYNGHLLEYIKAKHAQEM